MTSLFFFMPHINDGIVKRNRNIHSTSLSCYSIFYMLMGDGLNGRQTYEEIIKIRPELKAVVISGYSKKEEIESCKQLGISKFLEKPITMPILQEAIEQSLS